MSKLIVDQITSRDNAALSVVDNVLVTGLTTFHGSHQGINVTSGVTTSSISGNITGTACTFTDGTFSGTLTYEDVTNVDSVGLITARKGMVVSGVSTFLGSQQGINVTSGLSTFHNVTGNVVATAATVGSATTMDATGCRSNQFTGNLSGIAATIGLGVTITENILDVSVTSVFGGALSEKVNITAGKLSGNQDINIDKSMVHLFTTAEDTTSTPNIISNSGINTDYAVGDQISVNIVVNAAAAGYANSIKIDGTAEGCHWVGGSVPAAGGTNTDIYAFNIIKTGNAAYTVIGNHVKTTA